jgi:hypothetical protein
MKKPARNWLIFGFIKPNGTFFAKKAGTHMACYRSV